MSQDSVRKLQAYNLVMIQILVSAGQDADGGRATDHVGPGSLDEKGLSRPPARRSAWQKRRAQAHGLASVPLATTVAAPRAQRGGHFRPSGTTRLSSSSRRTSRPSGRISLRKKRLRTGLIMSTVSSTAS